MKEEVSKKMPNLDVLRFLLSLFVLVYHVPEISKNAGLPYYSKLILFNRGTEAVLWFFVLSGFLLSYLAKQEILIRQFNVLNFFQRRILRIWPLYFFVSIIGVFFYYFVLPFLNIPFENNAGLGKTILLTTLFLSNVLHADYDPGSILTVTWSVSVEEQFYLVFPFLVYFFYRISWVRKFTLITLLLIVFILHMISPSIAARKDLLGLHVELFFIGIFAAELFSYFNKFSVLTKNILMFLAVTLFFILFFTDWFYMPNSFFLWKILNGLAAALVILILSTWHKSCSVGWLNKGGQISYGIYMYHMIVITGLVFICSKIHLPGILPIIFINVFGCVLTYQIALWSFNSFESRFTKLKKY